MTGYIVIIKGTVIHWCLQIQKTVTLSTTEAEYSEITEVCCEILFICVILFCMVVVVEYPIIVHVDNIGAIFLSDNTSAYQQTKHINVRHHFIHDYVGDGTVKIKFGPFEENMADSFTNNLSNGPFESITSRYVNRE